MDSGQCQLKSFEKREKHEEKEEKAKEKKTETSAEKLRKLLKEEKRKKKRKKSSSSSSSTSSSESSSSSSSHKKHKKKRSRKHSVCSSRSRRHSSSIPAREDEQLTPPADTSASFLKQDDRRIYDSWDRPHRKSNEFKTRNRSLSSSSLELIDPAGGRSEDSRDSYSSAKTHASGSTSKSAASASKYRPRRRDSTASSSTRAEVKYIDDPKDRHNDSKTSFSRKSETYQRKYSTSDCGANERKPSGGGGRSYEQSLQRSAKTSHKEAPTGNTATSKDLPGNLLNILNQIAAFEKEKGGQTKT